MPNEIRRLLQAPVWRAFDADDQGRVLAGTDESGTIQLAEIGTRGVITPLTALAGACSGRYLVGQRAIVVQHDRAGDERQQLSVLDLERPPTVPLGLGELTPMVGDPSFFHNLLDVGPGWVAYATNRRNSVDFDLVVRDLASGSERILHDRGGAIEEAAVGPAARSAVVALSGVAAMAQQLVLVAGDSEPAIALTGRDEPAQHNRPAWYPEGRFLMVTTDRDRDHTVLARLDVEARSWTELVSCPGHDVTGWLSPDGRWLLAMTNQDGVSELALHDGRTGAHLRDLPLPDQGWVGPPGTPDPVWSPSSEFVAISFTSPVTPGDILLVEVASGSVRTITDSGAVLDGLELVQPTAHLVPAADGESIPCFLYRPRTGGREDGRATAVLHIHGGPESQAVRNFNPVVQGLVSAGHAVLVPNVRGSTGYGKRWYSADDVGLRMNAVDDLAALHRWLPQLGLDGDRVALWGGSYGGYMVLAGLAFQPELWAAGVDIVGISSLVTFLENTSAYRRVQREHEYGSLEDDREFLTSVSPLSRVAEIVAPLFVIHGANDPRVPLSEAEQLVAALRTRGVPCDLLVFPDEGHGLAKRANRLDAYSRALDFLEAHLGKPA
ncbi:MAG: alpha/beta hydrolase family protein [Candidatus Dormibacteria bacterium]